MGLGGNKSQLFARPPGCTQNKKITVDIAFIIIVIYFFDLTAAEVGLERKKCCC